MKKVIVFVITLFSIINLNAQQLFPLHIGDKWQYWENPSYHREVNILLDTLMSNGKLYYNFNEDYYRQNGDSVFSFDVFLNDEYLLFIFSANVGDTITNIKYSENDSLQIILTDKLENSEYLGARGTRYTIFVNKTQLIDDEISLAIFDSLGIVGRYSTWFNENLSGAILGGKVYGNITEVENKNPIKQRFELYQNYPNPFNPVTTINYVINKRSFVTLSIYNIVGEKVKNLVNEFQQTGLYKINFDANNLPSGIYFYKLSSNDNVLVKKLCVLK